MTNDDTKCVYSSCYVMMLCYVLPSNYTIAIIVLLLQNTYPRSVANSILARTFPYRNPDYHRVQMNKRILQSRFPRFYGGLRLRQVVFRLLLSLLTSHPKPPSRRAGSKWLRGTLFWMIRKASPWLDYSTFNYCFGCWCRWYACMASSSEACIPYFLLKRFIASSLHRTVLIARSTV